MNSTGEQKTTFLLVHGAWHGGWCYRETSDYLQKRGHRVFTPTLTGLGERSHLINDPITLDTHVRDIVNLVQFEDLDDIVVCAHSYGGIILTMALDQIYQRVRAAVFLDAMIPQNGQSVLDFAGHEMRDVIDQQIAAGAIGLTAPPPEAFNVSSSLVEWVREKMTPHPIGTFGAKIPVGDGLSRVRHKVFVRAEDYPSETFDLCRGQAEARSDWFVESLSGGHDLMVDQPEKTAAILLRVAGEAERPRTTIESTPK